VPFAAVAMRLWRCGTIGRLNGPFKTGLGYRLSQSRQTQ
jgi:hypothetical protein